MAQPALLAALGPELLIGKEESVFSSEQHRFPFLAF
jgi:hypothetical protein